MIDVGTLLVALIGMMGGLITLMGILLRVVFAMNRRVMEMEKSVNAAGAARNAGIRVFVEELFNKTFAGMTEQIQAALKMASDAHIGISKLREEVMDIRKQGRFYT